MQNMALNFILGSLDPIIIHDTYSLQSSKSNACQVSIYCPGKGKTIYAMSSDDINITVKSIWKSQFDDAIGRTLGGKLLDIIDNIAQFIGGYTIRQPYFRRKYWTGTDTLTFSLSFQFVSFSKAKTDAYNIMVSLTFFLYPRINNEKGKLDFFKHLLFMDIIFFQC